MIKEAVDYVEIHVMDDEDLRRLAVRILMNIESMWDKYQDDKDKGIKNARVIQKESLIANLVRSPLN